MTTPRLLMVMLALAFIDAGASQCPPEVPSVAAASPSCSLAISEKPETASILCSSNPFCEKNVCTNLVPPKANWPADFTSRFPGFPEKDFSSFVALCAYDQTCGCIKKKSDGTPCGCGDDTECKFGCSDSCYPKLECTGDECVCKPPVGQIYEDQNCCRCRDCPGPQTEPPNRRPTSRPKSTSAALPQTTPKPIQGTTPKPIQGTTPMPKLGTTPKPLNVTIPPRLPPLSTVTNTTPRATIQREEAVVLATRVSTAVGAVVAGVVATTVATTVAASAGGATAAGAASGPGALAIIGQVQVLSQFGKVGGGGGSLGSFSEGFGWANAELPFSFFPGGNTSVNNSNSSGSRSTDLRRLARRVRPNPGMTVEEAEAGLNCSDDTLSEEDRHKCLGCGLVNGVPLLDKAVVVCGSLFAIFCLRSLLQCIMTRCFKKDPMDAFMFPNWEGPLVLIHWFGMLDSMTTTLGRPCQVWVAVACVVIIVGPGFFIAYAVWKINNNVKKGLMLYHNPNPEVSWSKMRENVGEAKGVKNKYKSFNEWVTARRHNGEWTYCTQESKFWKFLLKDVSVAAWSYVVWTLLRKCIFAGIMTLTIGSVNALANVVLHFADASVILLMSPFNDNVMNLQETFSSFSNLFTMIVVSLPSLLGHMPDMFGDTFLIMISLMGTAAAAVTAMMGPVIALFTLLSAGCGALLGALSGLTAGLGAGLGGLGAVGGELGAVGGETLGSLREQVMESVTEVAEEISEEHWGGEDGDTDAGIDSSEIASLGLAGATLGLAAMATRQGDGSVEAQRSAGPQYVGTDRSARLSEELNEVFQPRPRPTFDLERQSHERQFHDPGSSLHVGTITRFTQKIVINGDETTVFVPKGHSLEVASARPVQPAMPMQQESQTSPKIRQDNLQTCSPQKEAPTNEIDLDIELQHLNTTLRKHDEFIRRIEEEKRIQQTSILHKGAGAGASTIISSTMPMQLLSHTSFKIHQNNLKTFTDASLAKSGSKEPASQDISEDAHKPVQHTVISVQKIPDLTEIASKSVQDGGKFVYETVDSLTAIFRSPAQLAPQDASGGAPFVGSPSNTNTKGKLVLADLRTDAKADQELERQKEYSRLLEESNQALQKRLADLESWASNSSSFASASTPWTPTRPEDAEVDRAKTKPQQTFEGSPQKEVSTNEIDLDIELQELNEKLRKQDELIRRIEVEHKTLMSWTKTQFS